MEELLRYPADDGQRTLVMAPALLADARAAQAKGQRRFVLLLPGTTRPFTCDPAFILANHRTPSEN